MEERGGGVSRFSVENFCLTVPTKFSVGESFIVALISGIEKVWRRGGEYQGFPSKIFCLTASNFSVEESFTVALIFGKRGGGVPKFYVENFLSHSADEIFRSRIFFCCINFGYRKSLEEGWGGIKIFGRKNLPHIADENFRRRIFYCCINFGYRKKFGEEGGGGVSRFSVEKFLSHSAENFRRGILYCCISFFGRGVSNFFVENFLSHGAEKFRRGMLYCCIIFWNRKCLEKGGCIKNFRQKFFVSQCRRKIP